jgi:hypothetical protein
MTEMISQPPGKPHVLAALALVSLVHVLFLAPPGFLTTDEFLYAAMVERLVATGSLFFANGPEEDASDALNLLFLTPTANGLAPQYPAGYAVLAAPFFWLGGIRGLMALNTLAAIGMVAVTYKLAELLYGEPARALNAALILALASFLADYAFAILPHATAGLAIVSAVYFAVAAREGARKPRLMAALSGLVLGLGIHFRVDVILIAPLLIAWLLACAPKPIERIALLLAGLLPGLAASSWANYARFGSLSPITYGRESFAAASDTTNLAAYQGLLPLLILGAAVTAAFGFARVRALFTGWKGVGILALGLAVVLAVPVTGGPAARALKGLYVLLVDLQSYDFIERFSGEGRMIEGRWLVFSGGVKKALFESLPYAGFLVLPLAGIFQGRRRAATVLLALLPLAWFGFFALKQWHGGQATNMRYFTPMLPFIAILAADAWHGMKSRDRERAPWGIRAKILVGLTALAFMLAGYRNSELLAFAFLAGVAKWVFFAGLVLALAILALPRAVWLLPVSKAVFAAGLLVAFMGGYLHDVKYSHAKRGWYLANRGDCTKIEPEALVIARLPRLYHCHFMRQQGALAIFVRDGRSLGPKLIGGTLAANRPVYTDAETAQRLIQYRRLEGYTLTPVPGSAGRLLRIRPARFR